MLKVEETEKLLIILASKCNIRINVRKIESNSSPRII